MHLCFAAPPWGLGLSSGFCGQNLHFAPLAQWGEWINTVWWDMKCSQLLLKACSRLFGWGYFAVQFCGSSINGQKFNDYYARNCYADFSPLLFLNFWNCPLSNFLTPEPSNISKCCWLKKNPKQHCHIWKVKAEKCLICRAIHFDFHLAAVTEDTWAAAVGIVRRPKQTCFLGWLDSCSMKEIHAHKIRKLWRPHFLLNPFLPHCTCVILQ